MIKNQDYSLLNKQISNEDMIKFCQIFEEKKISYTCEIFITNGPRYTYKFENNTKEINPFASNAFKNENVCKIKINNKYCKLQYGNKTENKIMFEGDENDDAYQYFFTKIDAWASKLKKLKRIKSVETGDVLFTMISVLLVVGITTSYAFLSRAINKNLLSTILSSIALGACLLVEIIIYCSAFLPYEIQIGLCKYKKTQKTFYSLFSLCIIPILTGLFA